MKKLFVLSLCLFVSTMLFAQRQSMTADFYKDTDYGAIQHAGKMTYTYIVSEEGTTLKDGALKINAKLGPAQVELWPYSFNLVGTYTSSANFVKGILDGTATSTNTIQATKLGRNSSTDTEKQIFSGNFKNGIPHGAFSVNRSTNGKSYSSLTANYNNGVLVGVYSCHLKDDDSRIVKYSGTLTQDGKFTGTWNLNGVNATFQKGVLVSATDNNQSTKPALVALAKQYAAGTITKEALMGKAVVVETKRVILGDYARIALFRDSGFEFKKLEGYDLTLPNHVQYEYLSEVAVLRDSAFEEVRKAFTDYYTSKTNHVALDDLIVPSIYDEDTTAPYIVMNNTTAAKSRYMASSPILQSSVKVYLPYEKVRKMMEDVESVMASKSFSLKNFIAQNIDNPHAKAYLAGANINEVGIVNWVRDGERFAGAITGRYYDFKEHSRPHPTNENIIIYQVKGSVGQADGRKSYIQKSSVEEYEIIVNNIEQEVKNMIIQSQTMSLKKFIMEHGYFLDYPDNVVEYIDGSLNTDEFEMADWQRLQQELQTAHKRFTMSSQLHTLESGEQVYMINHPRSKTEKCYITKASLNEYLAMIEEINSKQAGKLTKELQPLCDFLASNSTTTSIFFDKEVEKYFDARGLSEYWKLDAGKTFKQICPIIACEIAKIEVAGENREITLKITKKGKKGAGNICYLVPFKLIDNKISVKDMDLTKAEQVQ